MKNACISLATAAGSTRRGIRRTRALLRAALEGSMGRTAAAA